MKPRTAGAALLAALALAALALGPLNPRPALSRAP